MPNSFSIALASFIPSPPKTTFSDASEDSKISLKYADVKTATALTPIPFNILSISEISASLLYSSSLNPIIFTVFFPSTLFSRLSFASFMHSIRDVRAFSYPSHIFLWKPAERKYMIFAFTADSSLNLNTTASKSSPAIAGAQASRRAMSGG